MKTVLVIAGLDPSGGAGVLADVKAIGALGAYGAAAVTSVTFQNTTGVFGAEHVTAEGVVAQIRPVLDDLRIDAVKTGMLPTAPVIRAVVEVLAELSERPIVIDPVVRSTSGFDLVDDEALTELRTGLLPLATVVTPNVVEAERLTGLEVRDEASMEAAARRLVDAGAGAALVKGGHLDLDGFAVDVLFDGRRTHRYAAPRIDTRNTHGTGCTLASAIAALLAQGAPLGEAIEHAKAYVTGAIRSAPGLGRGHGPLDHFWNRR
jgi:hydroxymethylpyrimidine/phosphomethylpyrimidine kinase